MLYKSELYHKAMEATKNICGTKGEGTINHSTRNRLRNFAGLTRISMIRKRLGRLRTMDFDATLQGIEANPTSSLSSITQVQHFTIQYSSLPSQFWQKCQELLNYNSC